MFPILWTPKLCTCLFKMPPPQYTCLLRALLTLEDGLTKMEFSVDSQPLSFPTCILSELFSPPDPTAGTNKSCSMWHLCERVVVVLCTLEPVTLGCNNESAYTVRCLCGCLAPVRHPQDQPRNCLGLCVCLNWFYCC